MILKAIKIDELIQGDHYHLSLEDECYYLMEYIPGGDFSDFGNNTIWNFKKSMDRRGTPQWTYKAAAIRDVTNYFRDIYVPMINIETVTLVPIPPSKCKADPLYDDRMTQVLTNCFPNGCDIRDLIITKESKESSHTSGEDRPSLMEIQANLMLDPNLVEGVKPNVILFDDVITGGTHFKACKTIILESLPNTRVYGMFIARRVLPPASPFEFFA